MLIAAGRKPNIENLGLEAAGLRFSSRGVEVDARCAPPINAYSRRAT
jgi:dihydrolipoamide dehydrogenase